VASVDPVTFEVIRHRLRSITDEQAARVRTVSGSKHVTEMSDYNVGLYLGDGAVACMGRTILFHAASMASMVRHVIADCTANPGVGLGDMFVVNNPWKGSVHGPDLAVLAPVFTPDGELIFWSGAMMHMADIGGMREGSMGLDATETYQEGLLLPPVRLVESGVVRQDLWNMILTHSRVPGATALDLKGLIAANNSAVESLLAMAARYGADALVAVMRTIVDTSETRLRRRIRELPDMVTHAEGFLERDRATGAIARVSVTLTKRADTLTFDFSGSSPQLANAANCTVSGLMAGVTGALLPTLAYDIPWNEGIFRPVTVICPEGLICNARRPAAVSDSIAGAAWEVDSTALACVSRLLAASDAYLREAQAGCGGRPSSPVLHGTSQHGERFVGRTFESLASGGGAYLAHDGAAAFGNHSIERVLISNMETIEQDMPVLYLWRGLATDSGGAGMRRGGLSLGCAYVAHGATPMVGNQGHAWDAPSATGLFGGHPGASNYACLIEDSDVDSRLARGEIPAWETLAGVRCPSADLPGAVPLKPGAVLVSLPFGPAGWGDPLDRDVPDLQRDLDSGAVSPQACEAAYGVVISPDGGIDAAATSARRSELRAQRLRWPCGDTLTDTPAGSLTRRGPLSDQMELALDEAGRGWIRCSCGTPLSRADQNWRDFALVSTAPPAGPGHPFRVGGELEFRRYCCPGCGRQHAADIRPAGAPHLHDQRPARTLERLAHEEELPWHRCRSRWAAALTTAPVPSPTAGPESHIG
jgi:N-methylhydantoinase B